MLTRRIYYLLKPILPWRIRVGLRRIRARRILRTCGGVWPILPGSEMPPAGWSGWPDNKQFAFVLTHDVESQKGLDRCRALMELEKRLGFRSSFNFIPEGEYKTPGELRRKLIQNGFEIGVHDLHHDGKLYDSYKTFQVRAGRINQYLKEWGAQGFRSGFMRHNLDWLQELDVIYEGSTFDTDPFEPQPDGVGTIFPFWVPRKSSSTSFSSSSSRSTVISPPSSDSISDLRSPISAEGFVELPYTIAQDFTLFVVLREKTIDLWKRKVDWIVENGGMVLVNVHPDYLDFDNLPAHGDEFPVALYQDLLLYIRNQYSGRFWNALPVDVARYFRAGLDLVPQYSHSSERPL